VEHTNVPLVTRRDREAYAPCFVDHPGQGMAEEEHDERILRKRSTVFEAAEEEEVLPKRCSWLDTTEEGAEEGPESFLLPCWVLEACRKKNKPTKRDFLCC